MKNSHIKQLLLVFIMCFIACDDDSLTETNPNQLSVSVFWQNLKDTETGLAATYNSMLHENVLSILDESLRSDEGWPGFGRPVTNRDGLKILYEKTYNNSSGLVQNKWDACYTVAFRANQVIEALERIKSTLGEEALEEWTKQMGQARFFRGLMHFYLHTAYNNGSIIIRDRVPVEDEEFNLPLSPAEEVVAFFRSDLEYAYENLPARYDTPNENLGRVTKGAAATILGTSYLYKEDYTTAMVYFNDVINNVTADYGYELVEDTSLLFTTAGEFNAESIFELNYTRDYRTDIGVWQDNVLTNQLGLKTTNNEGPNLPAWLINAYKTDQMDPSDERNFYEDPDSPSGLTLRPVSLRTSSMIAIVDDTHSPYYGDLTGNKVVLGNNGWGFGRYKKYTNHDIGTGEGGDPRGSRASGKNIVVNRLADVYLMQAECLIKTGDVAGALEHINAVRHRWALRLLGPVNPKWAGSLFDLESYDENSLMERLMFIEKPLEMSMEGHQIRWNDLRRWGIIGDNFNKLSNETYYAKAATVERVDGTTRNRQNTSISTDPAGANLNIRLNTIDYEYDEAANNYDPIIHDYLPIPLNEVMRNPNIN
ncbi:RagB/SusD family nutrient uptake outer membrane protein [Flavivirga rizhaonensis]|uniref:RagB/SusD family nutrient uptake outer membrane protein n=1 Tax=Flavivirga rizhaonensis TaxID=2559571 RepID=A0A4S1DXS9_9FLAO|nr:RagB/SusD family nutrient uptake outer membrane protein [Flavivirga rizhaonensis]TGV02970.1 RagB/SusD family nutrient uptake outer membrane protein [Flavivirga rizhaonensis]